MKVIIIYEKYIKSYNLIIFKKLIYQIKFNYFYINRRLSVYIFYMYNTEHITLYNYILFHIKQDLLYTIFIHESI